MVHPDIVGWRIGEDILVWERAALEKESAKGQIAPEVGVCGVGGGLKKDDKGDEEGRKNFKMHDFPEPLWFERDAAWAVLALGLPAKPIKQNCSSLARYVAGRFS